jgi:hypothetical protein
MVTHVGKLCSQCIAKRSGPGGYLGIKKGLMESEYAGNSGSKQERGSTRNANQIPIHKDKSTNRDNDIGQDGKEKGPNTRMGYARIEQNVPSLDGEAANINPSIGDRDLQIFSSRSKFSIITLQNEDKTNLANKDIQASWVEIEDDPDWDIIHYIR